MIEKMAHLGELGPLSTTTGTDGTFREEVRQFTIVRGGDGTPFKVGTGSFWCVGVWLLDKARNGEVFLHGRSRFVLIALVLGKESKSLKISWWVNKVVGWLRNSSFQVLPSGLTLQSDGKILNSDDSKFIQLTNSVVMGSHEGALLYLRHDVKGLRKRDLLSPLQLLLYARLGPQLPEDPFPHPVGRRWEREWGRGGGGGRRRW